MWMYFNQIIICLLLNLLKLSTAFPSILLNSSSSPSWKGKKEKENMLFLVFLNIVYFFCSNVKLFKQNDC